MERIAVEGGHASARDNEAAARERQLLDEKHREVALGFRLAVHRGGGERSHDAGGASADDEDVNLLVVVIDLGCLGLLGTVEGRSSLVEAVLDSVHDGNARHGGTGGAIHVEGLILNDVGGDKLDGIGGNHLGVEVLGHLDIFDGILAQRHLNGHIAVHALLGRSVGARRELDLGVISKRRAGCAEGGAAGRHAADHKGACQEVPTGNFSCHFISSSKRVLRVRPPSVPAIWGIRPTGAASRHKARDSSDSSHHCNEVIPRRKGADVRP